MKTEFPTVSKGSQIYLDHNATTPVAKVVIDQMPQWALEWGNPSSIHQSGRGPKALIREARRNLSKFWGCDSLEIVFTSSGSEANNLCVKGVFERLKAQGKLAERSRFICSAIEHPANLKTFEYLKEQWGLDVKVVPVNRKGQLDLVELERLLKEAPTALVSVMYANNETGNVMPIKEVIQLAHKNGALVHSDMVQALGKCEFSLKKLNLDFATFSAHKFYALRGAGALYIKKGSPWFPQVHGGAQERSRRAGTENTLAIAAFGKMAEFAQEISERGRHLEELRDYLEARLLEKIKGLQITGAQSPRLPNSMSVIIPGVDGETLLMNLDMKGFSVSTGAACSSGSPEPSPVLLAMGLTRQEAQSSLRIGLGWGNNKEEIEKFIEVLVQTVNRLRSFHNSGEASSS